MSDGHVPDGTPRPTSVMPTTLGPTGGQPPLGPPPGAPPLGDDDGDQGQPPWVIPAIVGIVALAVVLLALILTRGDDEEALPAVDTTTTTISPDTTLGIVTETSLGASTTSVDTTTTTISPETTAVTTTTVAATTTVAPTTLAPTTLAPEPTGPTAQPVSAIGANTASLATADGEQTFAVLGTCASTPTVGLQAISSVLANESGTVYVVDVYLDEGEPFVEVADMSQSIAGFVFDQNTSGDNFRWNADVPDPNVIDQVTLVPLDGSSDPISLSLKSDGPTECGLGFVASPSPFPLEGPIELFDQFEPDVPGQGFAVLAACGDGSTYVTSGGGLIDISLGSGGDQFTSSYSVELPTDSTFWTTPDGVTANQQLIVQNGGGGDTDYATQVRNLDNDIGYLTMHIQPTVGGGLDLIDCPA